MPAIHDGAAVLANARRLAQAAQLLDVPVWGTEQNPTRLGPSDADLRALCRKTLPSPTAHREAETAKAHRG